MLEVFLDKKVLHPIIILISLWMIYFIFNRIVKHILKSKKGLKGLKSKKNKTMISLLNNLVKYFLIVIGVIMILNVYGVNTNSLLSSLGVASAVIALAFQDTLKDFLAGIFIVIEDQYDIGDTVTINGFKGEVVSIGLRMTKLKAFTGEYCFIANHNIGDVINHSLNKSLAVVTVQVSYDADLNKVDKILENLCSRLTNELEYLKGPVTVDGIEELADSGITYRISAETKPLKNLIAERKIRKEVKLELDKNHIEIPYPQLVIHNE